MSNAELYWVAGLLEGEGCFTQGAVGGGSNRFRQLVICCSMTDLDTIEKLQMIVGGVIEKKPRIDKRYTNAKPLYRWYITKRSEVEPLLKMLLPLMSKRRSTRIQELLDYSSANPPRYNVVRHGTVNEYRKGCKCDECMRAMRDRAREYRLRKRDA